MPKKPRKGLMPRLSERQQVVIDGAAAFNIISGGIQSGKSTLTDDVATAAANRKPGNRVLICVPDDAAMLVAKRRLYQKLGANVAAAHRSRLDLVTRASIDFVALDSGVFDYFDVVEAVVIDDAPKIPGFYEMWPVIEAHIRSCGAEGWIFGKPIGAGNGFGRLWREKLGHHEWQVTTLPTVARARRPDTTEPKRVQNADEALWESLPVEIAERQVEMEPSLFAQEYLGEVLDEELVVTLTILRPGETFLQWCERLAAEGLKVDGLPFRLDDRPTMRWVYEQIPSTVEEAFGKKLVLMKCAQVGFTVMEMLATIYLALKFAPAKIGMYVPQQALAALKSSERFMPIVRTMPEVYELMLEDPSGTRRGEGNVLVRNMGPSRFHFLWTSGKTTTESVPLDVLSFDEVQEMSIADMEKTAERLSASSLRYTLMGSTANWPDRDIHFWYKKGTQHQFWTECENCGHYQVLDNHFPDCIRLRDGDYRYVCHECDAVIPDPQRGEWRALKPDAEIQSIHYPQFLSPTISPRDIIEAYHNADDMKNFYNRKLGKPYTDPTQVPVDLEMLNDCAELGMSLGVTWKRNAAGTFMGIDQMGEFNVVLIAERLPTGHMAIIHCEEIYSDKPFDRCSELMEIYGVSVCVVEGLPNFNDAWRFAKEKKNQGRVFIAGYSNMADEMMRWGDAVPNKQQRKTDEDQRVRYTVTLDQYKCMQVAMKRIQRRATVFPDPLGLVQQIKDKGLSHTVPLLKDRVFLHFTRTALVAEKDEEERKYKRRVVKVGIDPHFSYAYMLLNVAWARSHGTTMFLTKPDETGRGELAAKVEEQMPGLPQGVLNMLELKGDVCGRCFSFKDGQCVDRGFLVGMKDPGCDLFVARHDLADGEEEEWGV